MLVYGYVNQKIDFNIIESAGAYSATLSGDVRALNIVLGSSVEVVFIHHKVDNALSSQHVSEIIRLLEANLSLNLSKGEVFLLHQVKAPLGC